MSGSKQHWTPLTFNVYVWEKTKILTKYFHFWKNETLNCIIHQYKPFKARHNYRADQRRFAITAEVGATAGTAHYGESKLA